MRKLISYVFFVLSIPAGAASFDCSLKLNNVENLICENQQVSALDEKLSDVYSANKKSSKNPGDLRNDQLSWLKRERNICKNITCLVQVYESRIDYLKNKLTENNTFIPAFEITQGAGSPLCKEYLNVLNKTPVNTIKACELPSLEETSIAPVVFKPLMGDVLKATDKIVYTQQGGGPWDDWEEQWPQRKKEYEIGYRRLGEAFWDLDQDGVKDRIIEKSTPGPRCTILGKDKASVLRKENRNLWKNLSVDEKLKLAKKYGRQKYYNLIKDGKLSFISADQLVIYRGEYISVDHDQVVLRETTNDWSDRNWIYIRGVNPTRNDKSRSYDKTSAICRFSLSK